MVASLIEALPHYNWTAMKITQHGHGICSAVGEPCDCAVEYDHPYAITEESAPGNTVNMIVGRELRREVVEYVRRVAAPG